MLGISRRKWEDNIKINPVNVTGSRRQITMALDTDMGVTHRRKISRLCEQIPADPEDKSMRNSTTKMRSIDHVTPLLSLRVCRVDKGPTIRIKAQNNKG